MTALAPLEALLAGSPTAEASTLVETRRDLHRHPELGFEETRTASIVAKRLAALGLSPRTGVGRTGVTASPGQAKGGRVLLRADMDGLPIAEETRATYASSNPQAMHACRHAAHRH